MKEYKSYSKTFSIVPHHTDVKKAKISSSKDINQYVRQFWTDMEVLESFFIVMLNNSNNTTGWVKISQGGITGTLVDVRILAKYALDCLAVSVILAHNHPSGTLKASAADKEITQKVKIGLATLDIRVLDHLIVIPEANNFGQDYYSFADENIL